MHHQRYLACLAAVSLHSIWGLLLDECAWSSSRCASSSPGITQDFQHWARWVDHGHLGGCEGAGTVEGLAAVAGDSAAARGIVGLLGSQQHPWAGRLAMQWLELVLRLLPQGSDLLAAHGAWEGLHAHQFRYVSNGLTRMVLLPTQPGCSLRALWARKDGGGETISCAAMTVCRREQELARMAAYLLAQQQ